MKESDSCPKCESGVLYLVAADDPDDIYPNSGRYEDYLECDTCGFIFEL